MRLTSLAHVTTARWLACATSWRQATVRSSPDRAPGELIATPRERRADPGSPYRRFAALPAERHVPIISELFDAHVACPSRFQ